MATGLSSCPTKTQERCRAAPERSGLRVERNGEEQGGEERFRANREDHEGSG